jgi:hypothetical protein
MGHKSDLPQCPLLGRLRVLSGLRPSRIRQDGMGWPWSSVGERAKMPFPVHPHQLRHGWVML